MVLNMVESLYGVYGAVDGNGWLVVDGKGDGKVLVEIADELHKPKWKLTGNAVNCCERSVYTESIHWK